MQYFEHIKETISRIIRDPNEMVEINIYFNNIPTMTPPFELRIRNRSLGMFLCCVEYRLEDIPKKINIKYHMQNDKLNGAYILYDKNGKVMQHKTYRNGELHGECIDYNIYMEDRKLIAKYVRTYDHGMLMP